MTNREKNMLAKLRNKKGVTQLTASEDLGINPKTYSRYESNPWLMNAQALHNMSTYFKVSMATILDISEQTDFPSMIYEEVKKMTVDESKLVYDFIMLIKKIKL